MEKRFIITSLFSKCMRVSVYDIQSGLVYDWICFFDSVSHLIDITTVKAKKQCFHPHSLAMLMSISSNLFAFRYLGKYSKSERNRPIDFSIRSLLLLVWFQQYEGGTPLNRLNQRNVYMSNLKRYPGYCVAYREWELYSPKMEDARDIWCLNTYGILV